MGRARKSARREKVVDEILGGLKSQKIYKTLDYRRKSESYLTQYMHRIILDRLCRLCQDLYPDVSERRNRARAEECLYWEGDVKTTINNLHFLGVQHRPDFKVKFEDLEVAVEIKRGESGAAVREGLGQAIVYAQRFDFVVYLFIDTSKDKKVLASMGGTQERSLIETLWDTFNIRFDVV